MSAEIITTSSGLRGLNPGIKETPSTALMMLKAGVITPSPISREIPMKESMVKKPQGAFFYSLKGYVKSPRGLKFHPHSLNSGS